MAKKSVEEIKIESQQLRGSIVETIESGESHFSDADYQLLKFHGTYQQDDRDLRISRKKEGLDKAWSFMVRTKQPGGNMTAAQYLAMDTLAEDIANGTLRITTRQGLQFHGILIRDLKDSMQRIAKSGMTTWGACGDVVRNTMAPSAPIDDEPHREAQRLAEELSDQFLAKSTSYTQIWLNGDKLEFDDNHEIVEEPLYGEVYLPRKFKIGITVPPRNDVDVFSQDVGLITHAPNGKVEGYNIVVGGGFGMSHGQQKTYPVLAKPLFYVSREHVVEAVVAIVTTQRDHGDRTNRKHARLKYLIEDRGLEWFRNEVVSRISAPTEALKPYHFDTVADMLGWHEQGNGKWFVEIPVEMGRIADKGDVRYRSGIHALATKFGRPMRFTPNTNAVFYDIAPADRAAFQATLDEFGLITGETLTETRKTAHACVSLPTCGLGLAESERYMPELLDEVDALLIELGLEKEPLLIRMTGCPNGCARPYNADIAFVGRGPGRYAFYVGGSIVGDRLAGLEQKTLKSEDIITTLRPYLTGFRDKRTASETFSAYWGRTQTNGDAPHPDQFHVELAEREAKRAAETK